jgi:hypothetical protein
LIGGVAFVLKLLVKSQTCLVQLRRIIVHIVNGD